MFFGQASITVLLVVVGGGAYKYRLVFSHTKSVNIARERQSQVGWWLVWIDWRVYHFIQVR